MFKRLILTLLFFGCCLETKAFSPALKLFGRHARDKSWRRIQAVIASQDYEKIAQVLNKAQLSGNPRERHAALIAFKEGTIVNLRLMDQKLETLYKNMNALRGSSIR